MSDTMLNIWMIAFLGSLLGGIPYGIWMIYTAYKKRWKRLGLQVGVPVLVYLLLVGATTLDRRRVWKNYVAGLFDTQVSSLGTPLFNYDSERYFNGDGYSFTSYELPAAIRARFQAADAALLAGFPKHPGYRDHWSFETWRQGPFDVQFSKHREFALSTYDANHESGLAEQVEAVRAALASDGVYYAFFYQSHGDRLGDIDFFLVDLAGNRLYLINHNT